jgi:hypothetical protein
MKVLSGFGTGTIGGIVEEITNCLVVVGIASVWFLESSVFGDEQSALGAKREGNEILGASIEGPVVRG